MGPDTDGSRRFGGAIGEPASAAGEGRVGVDDGRPRARIAGDGPVPRGEGPDMGRGLGPVKRGDGPPSGLGPARGDGPARGEGPPRGDGPESGLGPGCGRDITWWWCGGDE